MPRPNRGDIVSPDEVGVYHCYSRCTRGAYLCGYDPVTATDYSHRKQWIVDRQELLATVFALELLAFAILDNHMHHVIRTRPDIVDQWSDEEVIRRWHRLHPEKSGNGEILELTQSRIDALLKDKVLTRKWRDRLGSLSWYMKELKEPVAKRANRESGVTGEFFDSRFKSPRLADAITLLICMLYVDLNPVRAKIVSCPEAYGFCSFRLRFHSYQYRNAAAKINGAPTVFPDASIQPIPEAGETENSCAPGRRPSDKGILAMTTEKYLDLVDWSGRKQRPEKRGSIPSELAPIIERLGGSDELLADAARQYEQCLRRAGRRVSITHFQPSCAGTDGSEASA